MSATKAAGPFRSVLGKFAMKKIHELTGQRGFIETAPIVRCGRGPQSLTDLLQISGSQGRRFRRRV
jgi:hypothetical protein